MAEKAALTHRFLQRKVAEYEALKAELEALQAEFPVQATNSPNPSSHSS
jgi:hypothetical protein